MPCKICDIVVVEHCCILKYIDRLNSPWLLFYDIAPRRFKIKCILSDRALLEFDRLHFRIYVPLSYLFEKLVL